MSDDPDIQLAHAVDARPDLSSALASKEKGSRQTRAGTVRGQVMLVAALIGVLCWGAWMTRAVLDLRAGPARVVKVQLASLVGDFVRAEARGNASPDQIGPRTAQFMKVLDATIARHARGGQIILVSEAVVGGSVPDITADIAHEVRLTLPAVQPASSLPGPGDPTGQRRDAGGVEARMRDYLLHEGASQ